VNPLDRITLTGLRAFAHHGVLEHERAEGQTFVIDLTIHLNLAKAAAGDDLDQTVHYGVLAEQVVAAVERDPVDLIETVAERVAEVALAYDSVELVEVTVHKPGAPISVPFADVSVTIFRGRPFSFGTPAVVAFGSNLGDREDTILEAVSELASTPGVNLVALSPLVETIALRVDGLDPDAPRYVNAVALVTSTLEPPALLEALQRIENAHGRERTERWGDRTLDLDLIDFGGVELQTADLTLPHPRAHERDFVLRPWLAVDPDAVLAGHGRVAALLAELDA
jgi:dihydroneopterin aldolase/2-amino-4-hydroxy-6-hydroxymethyldihydropteridine diphosphokinase